MLYEAPSHTMVVVPMAAGWSDGTVSKEGYLASKRSPL